MDYNKPKADALAQLDSIRAKHRDNQGLKFLYVNQADSIKIYSNPPNPLLL